MAEVVVVRVIDLLIDELDERCQLKLQLQLGLQTDSLGRKGKEFCSLLRGYDRLFHDCNGKEEQGKSVEAVYLVFQ